MQSARTILKLFVTQQIDEWDVIEWGRDLHDSKFEEAIDLPHLERKATIEPTLATIAAPNEPTITERYHAIELIEKTLSRSIKPIELSTWVNHLDGRLAANNSYPNWLGELWNALGWCDEKWDLVNQPHLEKSLTKILAALTALDQDD